ncbi:Serine/threonine-protein kinase MRCK gamma [Actinomortierella ambigua]|nr:Serine/threonine-protein kinase MRCK gamma [Actinomortierella ambigua]
MLKAPFNVGPLGQNYTKFLESNDDGALGRFLQERLEKYRQCVYHISQAVNDKEFFALTNGSLPHLPKDTTTSGGIDALVDGLIAVHDDTRAVASTENWGALPAFWERFGKAVAQLKLLRINKDDFEIIKALTRGQYGRVSIVRSRLDGRIYAMKTLNKMYILSQKDKILYMEEREVLAISSEWFPTLHVAFQDEINLYLVMEYAPGGDLYSILDKKADEVNKTNPNGASDTANANENGDGDEEDEEDETTLTEDEIRFYIAEIVLAVAELHNNGYIHRDLKPQNILLDATGHVILADFGACARLDENGQVHGQTVPLGTWDYMSPEVVDAQSGGKPYGREVDWWAVGVILYELLVGEPPYFAESAMGIIRLLRDHEKNLKFDKGGPELSDHCRDLITRLLARKDNRLGTKGVEEIKDHPFFNGIDWENIRKSTPPFVPVIETPDDTSNFRFDDDLDGSDFSAQDKQSTITDYRGGQLRRFEGYNLAFIGYTYQPFVEFQSPLPIGSLAAPSTTALSLTGTNKSMKTSTFLEPPPPPPAPSSHPSREGRFRREASLAGLDREDVSKMRMEQEIFRLKTEVTSKEELLRELQAVHDTLAAQYEEQIAKTTAMESEYAAKLVGIAAVAERERVEAEEAMQELQRTLEDQTRRANHLEKDSEIMRLKCAELEHEIETQKESILKQEIEQSKVSILKAENEELRHQKEHDRLQENQLLLAEMERGTRLREENEALRLQMRELEKHSETTAKESREALAEIKKTVRGLQEDLAEQKQTRQKLQAELTADRATISALQREKEKMAEAIERKDAEIHQLTKACEAAVAAIDAGNSVATGGSSVKTIYPSMLKRERASNKVLIQQLEEQGEKIAEMENKIAALERDRERQSMRSPEPLHAAPPHVWQRGLNGLNSPTRLFSTHAELAPSSGDISGWIRISWPSTEKKTIKQSWKKHFLVLKDFKIFVLDKEGDPSTSDSAKLIADLRSDFFCVRTVSRSELIHATPKELECMFQIRCSSVGMSSSHSNYSICTTDTSSTAATPVTPQSTIRLPELSVNDIQARIDFLRSEIQKEEQIKRGAESIQSAWMSRDRKSDHYIKAKENVDACNKIIREKSAEIETLLAQLDSAEPQQSKVEPLAETFSAEQTAKMRELERLITIERHHLEAAEKMAAPLMTAGGNEIRKNWKSAVEMQLESSKQKLASLTLELEKLKSGSRNHSIMHATPSSSTSPHHHHHQHPHSATGAFPAGGGGAADWISQREIQGHSFRLKHYIIPKSCHQCHDVLWGSQKTGYECTTCKFIAHKQCLDVLTISCQEQQGLRHSKPIYLLAHDKHEQRRWIRTMEVQRKMAEPMANVQQQQQQQAHSAQQSGGGASVGTSGLSKSNSRSSGLSTTAISGLQPQEDPVPTSIPPPSTEADGLPKLLFGYIPPPPN